MTQIAPLQASLSTSKRLGWLRWLLVFLAGLFLGWLAIGWWLWPVQWAGMSPSDLSPEYQRPFLQLIVDLHAQTGNTSAVQEILGEWDPDDLATQLAMLQAAAPDAETAAAVATLRAALAVPEKEVTFLDTLMEQKLIVFSLMAAILLLIGAAAVALFPRVQLAQKKRALRDARAAVDTQQEAEAALVAAQAGLMDKSTAAPQAAPPPNQASAATNPTAQPNPAPAAGGSNPPDPDQLPPQAALAQPGQQAQPNQPGLSNQPNQPNQPGQLGQPQGNNQPNNPQQAAQKANQANDAAKNEEQKQNLASLLDDEALAAQSESGSKSALQDILSEVFDDDDEMAYYELLLKDSRTPSAQALQNQAEKLLGNLRRLARQKTAVSRQQEPVP